MNQNQNLNQKTNQNLTMAQRMNLNLNQKREPEPEPKTTASDNSYAEKVEYAPGKHYYLTKRRRGRSQETAEQIAYRMRRQYSPRSSSRTASFQSHSSSRYRKDTKPSFAEWCQVAGRLGLKRSGRYLQGPCPRCGGTDRFHVYENRGGEALAGCNQCTDPLPKAQGIGGLCWRSSRKRFQREPHAQPPHEQPMKLSSGGQFILILLNRNHLPTHTTMDLPHVPARRTSLGRYVLA